LLPPARDTRPPNGAADLTTALANNIAIFRQQCNLDISGSKLERLMLTSGRHPS
jgi:hypothetical protein